MDYLRLKPLLFQLCIEFVQQRILSAQQAMDAAQSSANAEDKSSAGDKYETGRAMAQIERDKAAQQLDEALKLKTALQAIQSIKTGAVVSVGSIVITTGGNFFLSISIGKVEVEKISFFVISPATPVGKQLINKRQGDRFTFNNQVVGIEQIL
jgi:transcription elongation GreA/GreB family factor